MATSAERARMLQLADDLLELLEIDMRTGDDAEWLQRIDIILGRGDGYFQEFVRLLSKWAAYNTMALAKATNASSMEDALHASRLVLMQWIEEWS